MLTMNLYTLLLILVIVLPAQIVHSLTGEIVLYSDVSYCNDSEYFNVHLLKCISCETAKNLQPTRDKQSCMCNTQSIIAKYHWSGFPECKPCPDDEFPNLDQRACLSCQENVESDNSTAKCGNCAPNSIRREQHMNGSLTSSIQCINCTSGTSPSADGQSCKPCREANCTCNPLTHELLDGVCIPHLGLADLPDDRNTYLVEYDSGIKVDSQFFRKHLRLSVFLCKLKNQTACQVVANLCTMVMYRDDYKTSPCKLFQDSKHVPTADRGVLPWLYYGDGDAHTVLHKKKISIKYNLDSHSQVTQGECTKQGIKRQFFQ